MGTRDGITKANGCLTGSGVGRAEGSPVGSALQVEGSLEGSEVGVDEVGSPVGSALRVEGSLEDSEVGVDEVGIEDGEWDGGILGGCVGGATVGMCVGA